MLNEFTEQQRLAALRRYDVLDAPEEAAFDDIAKAAAAFCGAPVAAVSLVDEARQWFMAKVGLDVRETPRDVSFCQHAMLQPDLYVVPDATQNALFSGNVMVTDDPHIRFYAGAPIKTPEGIPLGALCVIDTQVRPLGLTKEQSIVLEVLARQVEAQLELRRITRAQVEAARKQTEVFAAAAEREERLGRALQSAEVGWWDWDLASDTVIGNADMARVYGLDEHAAARGLPIEAVFKNVHPGDIAWLRDSIAAALDSGEPFREEYRLISPNGGETWISARGECLRDAHGKPWRFPGVAIDVTDRKKAEQRVREANVGRELALQAARLGRFDHNPSKGERFYDARALEIAGLPPGAKPDIDVIMARVHPEDRDALSRALKDAIDPERTGPFRQIYRIVDPETGEERWVRAQGRSQFSDGVCIRFMGVFEDVTEAHQADEHRRLLVNELNHRMKNTFAMVLALVESSLRNAPDPATARADVAGRIHALSSANDILTAQNWSAASVKTIVDGAIKTLSLPGERLELSGAAVRLGPRPALQLALALHELSTNAVKYGALSNDTGRLRMTWGLEDKEDGSQAFFFHWAERGGPTVTPPTRKGFGSKLIDRATAGAFGGEISLDYAPAGLQWRLTAPYAGLPEAGRAKDPI